MLNKTICKKCIKQWCVENHSILGHYELKNRICSELDNLDITWEYNHCVECPRTSDKYDYIGIYTDAPNECPYQLEHLLETQPSILKKVNSFILRIKHIFLGP